MSQGKKEKYVYVQHRSFAIKRPSIPELRVPGSPFPMALFTAIKQQNAQMICKQKVAKESIFSEAVVQTIAFSAAKGRYLLNRSGVHMN